MGINSEVNKEELINNYNETLKNNSTFRKLIKTIKVKPEIAMKYTSSLEETTKEIYHPVGKLSSIIDGFKFE